MCSMRSRWRLNGAYSSPISSRARCPAAPGAVPRTIRSGRMKSSTAAPSFRNSGFETIETGAAGKLAATASPSLRRRASSASIASSTLRAVPTGTVDFCTTTFSACMCAPMLRAAASTYCRSALPSWSAGVPVAMKISSPWRTASAMSIVKRRRRSAALRPTSSGRPRSWNGMPPEASRSIFLPSTSKQTDVVADVREARGGDEADVADTEDGDVHGRGRLIRGTAQVVARAACRHAGNGLDFLPRRAAARSFPALAAAERTP